MVENLQRQAVDLESLNDDSEEELSPRPPLLPRKGWKSQWAFLKALYRTKKALDELEQASVSDSDLT